MGMRSIIMMMQGKGIMRNKQRPYLQSLAFLIALMLFIVAIHYHKNAGSEVLISSSTLIIRNSDTESSDSQERNRKDDCLSCRLRENIVIDDYLSSPAVDSLLWYTFNDLRPLEPYSNLPAFFCVRAPPAIMV
jgi:hypothetical protein